MTEAFDAFRWNSPRIKRENRCGISKDEFKRAIPTYPNSLRAHFRYAGRLFGIDTFDCATGNLCVMIGPDQSHE